MHGRWGVKGQYLLELRVGSITNKLQNEPFTGREEGTTLPHAGQCHQPIHLAAEGGRVSVHSPDFQSTGKLCKDPAPWFSVGVPSTSTCPHPSSDPLTCGKSRRPPPRGPEAPGPGGPRSCSGGRERPGPTPDKNRGLR